MTRRPVETGPGAPPAAMTPVTEPFLPPLAEYVRHLEGIWQRNWLTNSGPVVARLEAALRERLRLEVPLHCVANGGLGLQIALKALGIGGEVITTPFSYVATASCPIWEGCALVYADIEESSLTLDPGKVEAAVSPRTEAIVATHVFGNPCDVEALQRIASRHGLAVIYDAAHAFGVTYHGESILNWGDASIVSLHATKLLHTVEGGLVAAPDKGVSDRVEWMRRFGHDGPYAFHGAGINGKMSELHAAMGLCCLGHIEEIMDSRRRTTAVYDRLLPEAPGVCFAFRLREGAGWNWSYYPVLCRSWEHAGELVRRLSESGYETRRYFHPSLDRVFRAGSAEMLPVTHDISARVVCLPIAAGWSDEIPEGVMRVCAGLGG